jgi:hypothetical protein
MNPKFNIGDLVSLWKFTGEKWIVYKIKGVHIYEDGVFYDFESVNTIGGKISQGYSFPENDFNLVKEESEEK